MKHSCQGKKELLALCNWVRVRACARKRHGMIRTKNRAGAAHARTAPEASSFERRLGNQLAANQATAKPSVVELVQRLLGVCKNEIIRMATKPEALSGCRKPQGMEKKDRYGDD